MLVDPTKFRLTSPMRLMRVHRTLSRDPYFARYLKGKTTSVRNRAGTVMHFPRAVIKATAYLAWRGIDAHTCPKETVLAAGIIAVDSYRVASRH